MSPFSQGIAKYDKLKTYEFVSSDYQVLVGTKIIGSGILQSFKANFKAIQGDLFPLERYMFLSRTQFRSINRDKYEITEAYLKDNQSRKDDDDSSDDFKASGSNSGSPSESDSSSDSSGAKTASNASGDIEGDGAKTDKPKPRPKPKLKAFASATSSSTNRKQRPRR
ncbi:hypothetical protein BYT27DRAFT_7246034 [Phlegmacium glaucopus]|nr:hypothetical protein BYT27DRAFT_7246034 [Phlegmacium glaucopus]